jgi:hypothetical protein
MILFEQRANRRPDGTAECTRAYSILIEGAARLQKVPWFAAEVKDSIAPAHRLVPGGTAGGPLGRPATDCADEVGELLISFACGSFAAVDRWPSSGAPMRGSLDVLLYA